MKTRQKKSYNAFRGIAAIFIMFSHLSFMKASAYPICVSFYDFLMSNGAKFTSFFYITSGFLACYAWKKSPDFMTYIKKKLKKIYPIVLFVFFLALVLDLVLSGNVINEIRPSSPMYYVCIVLNLLMLKAIVPVESVFYSFHGPYWFLTALFGFYIIAYWLVPKIKDESTKAKTIKRTAIICGIAYAVEFVICIVVQAGINAQVAFFEEARLWLCYVNPFFRVFGECFLGVLLCEGLPQAVKRIRNKTTMEIIAVLVLAVFYFSQDFISLTFFSSLLWAVPIAFILFAFYCDAGGVSHILEKRGFQWLGKISFELYMTHAFVYEGIPVAFKIIGLGNWIVDHAEIRFLITVPACLIFAWIVHGILDGSIVKMVREKIH